MNIRVEEIRKLERGSLRGFATVNVGGFIRISHIQIIQPDGQEASVQIPQRNVVDLPDDVAKEVERAVLWFWNQEQHSCGPEQ